MSEQQLTAGNFATAQRSGLSKRLLLGLLSRLSEGSLTLKEQGNVIATFGDGDSSMTAEFDVLDNRFYKAALLGGGTAVGEAFVDGWWTSPDVTRVVRLFARNVSTLDHWESKISWLLKPVDWIGEMRRRNTLSQSKRNILAHYDLGNELYIRFLDKQMQYSAAIFDSQTDTLDQAQSNKLKRICDMLELSSDDHLLEIGSGWGGLAVYAAQNYGCHVTTTTISDAQYDFAKRQIEAEGLTDRIELLNRDYRLLEGRYDKIVSVEMVEAVGRKFLPQFFQNLQDLLKPGGKILIQAITIADQRYDRYSNRTDFIRKHIFPGGFLPSLSALTEQFSNQTNLVVSDVHDMGIDYAQTLNCWRQRLLSNREELATLNYDDRFMRLWLYYFGYCEGGFLERRISAVQILASE
jgi:cyclopropane-fatty-acyl-phospholipid synthase